MPIASRLFAAISLLAAIAMFTSQPVKAAFNVIPGDFVRFGDGPGTPGGVFYIDVRGKGGTRDFDTFCVELTENVRIGTEYYVQDVGLHTVNGDRYLGEQAAWLYTQFIERDTLALAGFTFSLVDTPELNSSLARKQADALQLGIWRGMIDEYGNPNPYSDSEITARAGWNQTYIDYLTTTFLDTSSLITKGWLEIFRDDSSWNGTGSVKIMNLRGYKYNKYGELVLTDYAQDQLVHITPELPALCSMCGALLCAGVWMVLSAFKTRLQTNCI